MRPAFSVVFLTTLIGAGQGLFIALYLAKLIALVQGQPVAGLQSLMVAGSAVSVAFCLLGLAASFFHLGHPARAWRAASCWRTSWLSREVIALPLFMAMVTAYGVAHHTNPAAGVWMGGAAMVACLALFLCTAMIYASIRVIREWASAFTVINYLLLGSASGFTLATVLAAALDSPLLSPYSMIAGVLILAGLASRSASIVRNRRLKPRTTLQTAIDIKHPRIVQKAQGSMGGSFNTREFFHGKSAATLRAALAGFVVSACVVPVMLLWLGRGAMLPVALAFASQYLGLLAERWLFFAEASHPQNLYYQSIS